MGTSFAGGFLQGFLGQQNALRQEAEQRRRADEELALKKEDLKLRQQILRGQEAERTLNIQAQQLTIQQKQREALSNLLSGQLLGNVEQQQPLPQGLNLQPQSLQQEQPLSLDGGGAQVQPQQPIPIPGAKPAVPAPAGKAQRVAFLNALTDQIGQSEGIRPEVIQLAKTSVIPQESTYNPNAVSPKGAKGLMQLMDDTAQGVGVQDPFDPRQNIRGGLRYLQQQYDKYGGDIAKTLAAYNAGPGAVDKYNGVPPFQETQKYVSRGVAAYQAQRPGGNVAGQVVPPVRPTLQATPELLQLDQQLLQNRQREQQILDNAKRLELSFPGTNVLENARVKDELKRIRDDRQELISQRNAAVNAQTANAGSELAQLTQLYGGDRQRALDELNRRQNERARNTQAAGREFAAERAAQTDTAKRQAEKEFRESQALFEADPKNFQNYFDRNTGEALPEGLPYSDVKKRVGKDVRILTDDQRQAYQKVNQSVQPLLEIRNGLERIYGPGGIFENLQASGRLQAGVKGALGRYLQENPDLVVTARLTKGNVDALRRAFQGQVGTQTEGDAQRGLTALAQLEGLLPDSKEVAFRITNTLIDAVNRIQGQYLRNKDFRVPGLDRLDKGETLAETPAGAGTLTLPIQQQSTTNTNLLNKHIRP
jgi:hypothetical protein